MSNICRMLSLLARRWVGEASLAMAVRKEIQKYTSCSTRYSGCFCRLGWRHGTPVALRGRLWESVLSLRHVVARVWPAVWRTSTFTCLAIWLALQELGVLGIHSMDQSSLCDCQIYLTVPSFEGFFFLSVTRFIEL